MDATLRVSWWALMGAMDELGDGYAPGPETLNTVMVAKRQAVLGAVEVVNLAMDTIGGQSYFRRCRAGAGVPGRAGGHLPPLHPGEHAGLRGQTCSGTVGRSPNDSSAPVGERPRPRVPLQGIRADRAALTTVRER